MRIGIGNKLMRIILFSAVMVGSPVISWAFSGVTPIQPWDGPAELSVFYTLCLESEFEIELENTDGDVFNTDINVERDVIGVSFAFGGTTSNLYLSAGLFTDSQFGETEMGNVDSITEWDYEKGGMFALGLRGMLYDMEPITFHGYIQAWAAYSSWTFEDVGYYGEYFENQDLYSTEFGYEYTIRLANYDLSVGAACQYEFSDLFYAYGAFEITPLSSGQGGYRAKPSDGVYDYYYELLSELSGADLDIQSVERKDMVTIKGGAIFATESFFLRGEISFVGEECITFDTGFYF